MILFYQETLSQYLVLYELKHIPCVTGCKLNLNCVSTLCIDVLDLIKISSVFFICTLYLYRTYYWLWVSKRFGKKIEESKSLKINRQPYQKPMIECIRIAESQKPLTWRNEKLGGSWRKRVIRFTCPHNIPQQLNLHILIISENSLVFTVASDPTDGYLRYIRSAKHYGIDVKTLGLGKEWLGGDMSKAGGGYKITLLKEALKQYKGDENRIVLFTDR